MHLCKVSLFVSFLVFEYSGPGKSCSNPERKTKTKQKLYLTVYRHQLAGLIHFNSHSSTSGNENYASTIKDRKSITCLEGLPGESLFCLKRPWHFAVTCEQTTRFLEQCPPQMGPKRICLAIMHSTMFGKNQRKHFTVSTVV